MLNLGAALRLAPRPTLSGSSHRFRIFGLAGVAIAFWLRLVDLERANIWFDEAWTVWVARLPFADRIDWLVSFDTHPPLHYTFVSLWSGLVGESAYAIRFSSVAFGVLAVAIVYATAKRLGGGAAAIAAAFVLALAPFHIWWSQEIRMYSVAAMFAALSTYLFARILDGDRSRLSLAGLAVVTAACVGSLYLFIFVPLLQAAIIAARWAKAPKARRPELWRMALVYGAALLIFLPWLLAFLPATRSYTVESIIELDLFARLFVTVLPLGVSTDLAGFALPALILWLAAAAGAIVAASTGRIAYRWVVAGILLTLATAPAVIFFLSQLPEAPFIPKVGARYVAPFVPLFMLLVGLGLGAAWRRSAWVGLAAGGLVIAALLPSLGSYYSRRAPAYDQPAAATVVQAHAQPGDVVILLPAGDWPVYRYYAPWPQNWLLISPDESIDANRASTLLSGLVDRNTGAWLITTRESGAVDPNGEIRAWLDRTYRVVDERRYGDSVIRLYSPDAGRTMRVERGMDGAAPASLVESMSLAKVAPILPTLRAGEVVPITLYWTETPPQGGFQIRLNLVDERDGTVYPRRSAAGGFARHDLARTGRRAKPDSGIISRRADHRIRFW